MAGDWGSRVVELAASWAIVMIFTGLYLWWPRRSERLAGVLYIRLRQGKRTFWRDLPPGTGIWWTACELFVVLKCFALPEGTDSFARTGPRAALQRSTTVLR